MNHDTPFIVLIYSGVHIQEEVLAELNQAQVTCFNLRDSARQHHQNRAKICTKLIKYPNVEDYTLALKEHDEKQTLAARQHLQDIRNMYAILTDMMHKNIAKVRGRASSLSCSMLKLCPSQDSDAQRQQFARSLLNEIDVYYR